MFRPFSRNNCHLFVPRFIRWRQVQVLEVHLRGIERSARNGGGCEKLFHNCAIQGFPMWMNKRGCCGEKCTHFCTEFPFVKHFRADVDFLAIFTKHCAFVGGKKYYEANLFPFWNVIVSLVDSLSFFLQLWSKIGFFRDESSFAYDFHSYFNDCQCLCRHWQISEDEAQRWIRRRWFSVLGAFRTWKIAFHNTGMLTVWNLLKNRPKHCL